MASIFTDLAVPQSIEDLCETRDAALRKAEKARRLLGEAKSDLEAVGRYLWPYEGRMQIGAEDLRRKVDRGLWRHAFDRTGLLQFMDEQARKEFERELEKNPPPFEVETIRSTLISTASNADEMFVRGMVNVLGNLSHDHKTTADRFKIGRKAILQYMIESNYSGGLQVRYNGQDRLNDIDRVFKTLDNKKHESTVLRSAVNQAFAKQEVFEDDYYQMRGFKNGNLHIVFLRQDLLDKANMLIGTYYDGRAIGRKL